MKIAHIFLLVIGLTFLACDESTQQIKTTGTFVDSRDGTVYRTVKIGNYTWMAENLRYLPYVNSYESMALYEQRFYVYGYTGTDTEAAKKTDNYKTYGVLYNVQSAHFSCPAGWHIPSEAEFNDLISALGGADVAGDKLKELGSEHWISNTTGTNTSLFCALPGGYLISAGAFNDLGTKCVFWSSTKDNLPDRTAYYILSNDKSSITKNIAPELYAFSIRCVKD